ncbi:hypothetical protein [Nonomuraea typhae]|uniref:Uncharacterized protein n=1 Tax=Nonomuraea typhae TaxID=2603600 RepID=A0ABW7Z459_9ACTN
MSFQYLSEERRARYRQFLTDPSPEDLERFFYLDTDWLRHHQIRWPNTANPHLLINHKTALTTAPASVKGASEILHRQPATLERLRMDRILEEALACGGDPLHLASVFGLDTKTAIRYADSARELLTTTAEEQDPAHSDEPKGGNHP